MVFRLFLVAVLLFCIHLGWQFAEPPIKNAMLQGEMKEVVKNRGLRSEKEMRRDVMAFVREKNISLGERSLVVRLDNSGVTIAAKYSSRVHVLFIDHEYEFIAASNETARRRLTSF